MERKICFFGLGYIGLMQALRFSRHKPAWGWDKDALRTKEIKAGTDRHQRVSAGELESSSLHLAESLKEVRHCDFFILMISARLKERQEPDLTPLKEACRNLGHLLKEGDIVVFEAALYPGAIQKELVPILEEVSGLICEVDFTLGYAPQSIDLWNQSKKLDPHPRLLAASDALTLALVQEVYGLIHPTEPILAPTIEAAEAAQMFEYVRRDVNLGLVNEFALFLDRIQLDSHLVLTLAKQLEQNKNYYPGLVGGQHVGLSPYFLDQEAQKQGLHPIAFQIGRRVNAELPMRISHKAVQLCSQRGLALYGLTATLLGLGYKPNVGDVRHSAAISLSQELKSFGLDLQLNDPLVNRSTAFAHFNQSPQPFEGLKKAHLLFLLTAHQAYLDWDQEKWLSLLEPKSIVIDLTGKLDLNLFSSQGHLTWRL